VLYKADVSFRNGLLADEHLTAGFARHLEAVSLSRGTLLETPERPPTWVYFIEYGIVSVLARSARGQSLQVAMIGAEGATGSSLLLGSNRTVHQAMVEFPVRAWAMSVESFHALIPRNFKLRNKMLRYTGELAAQVAATALANGRCTVEERVARWILQVSSRLGGANIEVTHDRIGEALAVRRPSVTDALQILEGDQAIRAQRGMLTVLDRDLLAVLAGGYYRDGD
jgi:CRP-like cAMP-binding protein